MKHMPRAPRYHVPDDVYHVISRGNHRETVFRDDCDFLHYLTLIERYGQRYMVKAHAYALMRNHVHLVVQESEQPLSRLMQGCNRALPSSSTPAIIRPDTSFREDTRHRGSNEKSTCLVW